MSTLSRLECSWIASIRNSGRNSTSSPKGELNADDSFRDPGQAQTGERIGDDSVALVPGVGGVADDCFVTDWRDGATVVRCAQLAKRRSLVNAVPTPAFMLAQVFAADGAGVTA